ncbi:glycosylphosphatidylinositol-anchored high density lipoprotein-binding protein 1 [Acomys russatus]|uniref:glycosylphosphatidylinositol-anchored high density lipoprotein-binding protein 1 n=1 Tax=Acomys russatus TaxID=60746 RepID=UPI0021E216D0|nr:glycosylphosphatidylinositol-anchored high density lipoprotein-binding protein 1 [Acomys russatus]
MKPLSAVLLILLLIGQPGSRWAREEGGAVNLGPERDIFGDDDDDDDNDDDDEEEEEEETNMIPGSRDRVPLQCYFCQVLHTGENCNQIQNCSHSEAFCTTLISHSNTDKGLLVTHSMWCADTCRPIIKTVEGTQVTQTCCQSTLCNILPWQSPQIQNPLGGRANRPLDGGARHPQGGSAGSPLDGGARHPQGGRVDQPQVVKAARPRPRSDGASLPKGGKANWPQGSGAGCPSGWTKFGNTALLLSFLTSLWASGA